jgi:CubicO group peptidase (beta-lactamase class C family)
MKWIVTAIICVSVLVGGLMYSLPLDHAEGGVMRAASPVERTVLLRAPAFDEVAAFGEVDKLRIDAWLLEQVVLARYPSLSVAVVREGEIVYQGAFGFADLEARREATPETSYHVASVTKAFTASLAAMLHDRGVVDLDRPVVTYLPEGVLISAEHVRGGTITLRQLASHTSGLPRGVPGPVQSLEGRYQLEPKRLYEHLANVTLVFEPGTDELYSNLGMGLLGHVLERAAGKPYDQLLKETVCDPLGLERTTIHIGDDFSVATGYGSRIPRRPQGHAYARRLAPSGGLIASATDLARFLAAQMEPGLLSGEALAQLHTSTRLSDGSSARTGLGWSLGSLESIGRVVKKNGGRNNCMAWIGFAPDHRVGVAVITNSGGPMVDGIGYWLLERSVPGVDPSLLSRKPFAEFEYAKVAPYTGVRWENDRPVVRVEGRWSPLVSIDGIPIDRIMEFAREAFGEKARQRLAEDLVELLSLMGHEPGWEVTLGMEIDGGQLEHLEVEMTEGNRKLVRN